MKIILGIIAVLFSSISLAQEENTSQLEPVRMTLQKQSSPSLIKATITSANNKADNNNSKAPIVKIIVAKSAIAQGEKATLSLADDKTHITNAVEVKKVTTTVERSSTPQSVKATVIKLDQKQ